MLCSLIISADLITPQSLVQDDYYTCFHVAGWLVNHQQTSLLYPPAEMNTFQGAPFDLITHRFLPMIPKSVVALFMYCPLVAFFFAPLAVLKTNIGLLIWQAFNLVCLVASCFFATDFLTSTGGPAENSNKKSLLTSLALVCCSFLYLPVFDTLWIGQLDIAVGLMPLVAGFLLMSKKRPMLAGFVWSIVFLKPQLFPCIALIVLGSLLRGNWKVLLGTTSGVAAIFGLCIALTNPDTVVNWLASLRLSDGLFSGKIHCPEYLTATLPAAIVVSFPMETRLLVKPYVYGFAALIALVNLFWVWKLARNVKDDGEWLRLNAALAPLSLIAYSPRLLTYDWVFFLISLIVILMEFRHNKIVFRLALAIALLVNVDIIFVLFRNTNIGPLILATSASLCFLAMVMSMMKNFAASSSSVLKPSEEGESP